MSPYLVTGGAGFIGSHVVEALVARGKQVRVLDDLSTGHRENLDAVIDQIELLVGDVSDPATVSTAIGGCERVIHLAAIASVQESLDDPSRTHQVNVTGTLNVLEAARRTDVRGLVFASSAAVYGDHTALPLAEELPPLPLSPYAASKAAGESYCRAFFASYDLPTVALRFFNVYGPRQDPSSPYSGVISIFADRMSRGKQPIIYGDGEQTRDFVAVKDVVRAVLAACERDEAIGGVFNVASGEQTNLLQLVTVLNQVLGADLKPILAPPRAGEVRHSQADARRAQQILGVKAQVSLEEGLRDLVQGDYR